MWYTNGAMDYVYKRSEFRRPPAQLEHVDMEIRFFEDRVEASGMLYGRVRKALNDVELHASGTEV